MPTIPILNASAAPDDTGEVYFEQFAVEGTNDLYGEDVLVYSDPSTKISCGLAFRIPEGFSSAPKVKVVWGANAITGDVVWDVDYRAIASSESLDPSSHQESVTTTVVVPGTALNLVDTEISLAAGNFAAGDLVKMRLSRDGTDGNEDLADKVLVQGIYFVYTAA